MSRFFSVSIDLTIVTFRYQDLPRNYNVNDITIKKRIGVRGEGRGERNG